MRFPPMLATATTTVLLGSCGAPATGPAAEAPGLPHQAARYGLLTTPVTCPTSCTAALFRAQNENNSFEFQLADNPAGDLSYVEIHLLSTTLSSNNQMAIVVNGNSLEITGTVVNSLDNTDTRTVLAVLNMTTGAYAIQVGGANFTGGGTITVFPGQCTLPDT